MHWLHTLPLLYKMLFILVLTQIICILIWTKANKEKKAVLKGKTDERYILLEVTGFSLIVLSVGLILLVQHAPIVMSVFILIMSSGLCGLFLGSDIRQLHTEMETRQSEQQSCSG